MKQRVDEFLTVEKCKNILTKLINIDTTHPNGNEMDIVKLILSLFDDYNIRYKIFDHGNNRGSLIITIPGISNDESIAFIGHIDTVPVENIHLWKYPPFDGTIENDFIYGRGTVDMKGGVTCMILTALYFLENKITPPIDIHFCFTADEEMNGMGALGIRDSGYLDNTKEIFISEPTDEKLGIAEKGALWLEIQVQGTSAHSSSPNLGINAIEYLIDYINKLKSNIDTTTNHPLLGTNTISITSFYGGLKTNVIPANARATVDIRTIAGYSHENIIKIANVIAEKMTTDIEGLKIKINILNNRPALEVKEDNYFIKKLKDLCSDAPNDCVYKGLFYYTDASQIIPYLKVPFVILGPGDDKLAHMVNERINLHSIIKVTEIYIKYLLSI